MGHPTLQFKYIGVYDIHTTNLHRESRLDMVYVS